MIPIKVQVYDLNGENEPDDFIFMFETISVPRVGESVFLAGGDEYIVRYVQWQLSDTKNQVTGFNRLQYAHLHCEKG